MVSRDRDPAITRAITAAGGVRKLGEALGITHAAVSRWGQVPVRYVLIIEQKYHIPRDQLRPDVYPPEPRGRPRQKYSSDAK